MNNTISKLTKYFLYSILVVLIGKFIFDAGFIAQDGPADLTIFDPEADRLVTDHFASKAANSPFVGEKLKGQVKFTICDGEVVFKG